MGGASNIPLDLQIVALESLVRDEGARLQRVKLRQFRGEDYGHMRIDEVELKGWEERLVRVQAAVETMKVLAGVSAPALVPAHR